MGGAVVQRFAQLPQNELNGCDSADVLRGN